MIAILWVADFAAMYVLGKGVDILWHRYKAYKLHSRVAKQLSFDFPRRSEPDLAQEQSDFYDTLNRSMLDQFAYSGALTLSTVEIIRHEREARLKLKGDILENLYKPMPVAGGSSAMYYDKMYPNAGWTFDNNVTAVHFDKSFVDQLQS